MKYIEILEKNEELKSKLKSPAFNISILSNITINQLKEVLELSLRTESVNAQVRIGNYDNIIQDSSLNEYAENVIVLFWEACNFIDGLHHKITSMDILEVENIIEKTKNEIDLVFNNLEKSPLLLVNEFSDLHFKSMYGKNKNFEYLIESLNSYLKNVSQENIKLIDLDIMLSSLGVEASIDTRYYYSSKSLYTISFLKSYVYLVKPFIMSLCGKTKKALIFDCDNTLWKGILGEDGFDNLEMSANTSDGSIYSEIQSLALELQMKGVILGLCSKNNPEEVDKVLEAHPDMKIQDRHLTIKKCNWLSKVENLRDISTGLNIGLDSIVFIDDSDFEVELIKAQLPEIHVIQVPKRLHRYPGTLRDNLGLFYNLSNSSEDRNKTEMYKQGIEREESRKSIKNIDEYLASLEIGVSVYIDEISILPRLAQLTQKTNQFNLTTKRYTEVDIKSFIMNPDRKVIAISVEDKFGDSGITGLCIVNIMQETKEVSIDTYLLSCRILGRKIEYALLDFLFEKFKEWGVTKVFSNYIPSQKNMQVQDFYDKALFSKLNSVENSQEYYIDIAGYSSAKTGYKIQERKLS